MIYHFDVRNTGEVQVASKEGMNIIAKTMEPFEKNQGESLDPYMFYKALEP